MASEWEELERLSKDELIIELVHWKTLYSILRGMQDESCYLPKLERKTVVPGDHTSDLGELTTDEWAEKVALYAAKNLDDDSFASCDLMDYGLTDEQSYQVCKRLLREGRLVLPDGAELVGEY